MTPEEKAKRYDDALKLAKDYHEDKNCFEYLKSILEDIFPELKESKDEKIRKELIEHIKANRDVGFVLFQKFSPDDVIAWLEKQASKSKWSDEDEQYLLVCKNALHKYQWSDKWDADLISKWLENKLKQRMEEQR